MGQHRRFGLPVREAKETLVIPLLQVDIDKARAVREEEGIKANDKKNFTSCVIAQGVTRAAGADRVAILHTVAYVAFPGDRHAKRYVVDSKSRDVLERWDRGEPIIEGVELRLRPPAKTHTRRAKIRQKAKSREVNKGRELPLTDRKPRTSPPVVATVRNGNIVRWA